MEEEEGMSIKKIDHLSPSEGDHLTMTYPFVLMGLGFGGSLVICQVLASKIAGLHLPVVGMVVFPAGIVAYASTFTFTDVIEEIWGKRAASWVVRSGFWVNIIVWGHILIARFLPSAPFWTLGEGWTNVFNSTSRIIFASMVAYLTSQHHDLWMFALVRRLTGGRYLWLRNNLSTIISQTIDTTIFITIAFWGEAPLLSLIGGQLVIKWLLALLDTPLVYLLVFLLRRHQPEKRI